MNQDELIELWTLLKDAPDYRAFMNEYVNWRKSKRRDFGFASLARDAGFSARSYPRDVIRGTRKLTAASIPRFTKAMKLTGEAARYFSLLVYRDRPELFHGPRNANISELMEKSRVRLLRQIERSRKQMQVTKFYPQDHWPLVHASLGPASQGSTIEEISARCRIPPDECRKMLDAMISLGFVQKSEDSEKYITLSPFLYFQNLRDHLGFKNFFLGSLERAKKSAQLRFDRSTDHLFFASVISIKRSELQSYRNKLRDFLGSFAENAESPDGEDVITIVCSLFPGD